MRLEVRGLSKTYGPGRPAVLSVSHVFPEGRISALLGPSGSGKSTTLSMIAGLTDPDAGFVLLDGKDVTNVPAEKRDIGIVFQNYALFPHLSVLQNVAFGLRTRGVKRADRLSRARDVLETVRMGGFEGRSIDGLSGGEQQRVALARALAFRPRILLLDEPLSALDAKLREDLRSELFGLLRALALTTVYVTHDQAEALALGDELVVMREGLVEQAGRPADVYHRPASPFVARFLGAANLVAGDVSGRGEELRLPFATLDAPPGAAEGPCWAMLRPEDLEVVPSDDADFTAALVSVQFLGPVQRLRLFAGRQELLLDAPNDLAIGDEARIPIRMKREKIVVFARAEGELPPQPSAPPPDVSAASDVFPRIVN
jgi:putative spermidine/putrescine transport system ATP-binding protein